MTKLKVSEATNNKLNWMVGMAMGFQTYVVDKHGMHLVEVADKDYFGYYMGQHWAPSTDWSQGGPIIGRERISVIPFDERWEARCACTVNRSVAKFIERRGPTPLIAAMRCYVASKLGDEVDVPEELM